MTNEEKTLEEYDRGNQADTEVPKVLNVSAATSTG